MRFVKKEDLRFENGYIIDPDGNIVGVGDAIVQEFNELEVLAQKTKWMRENRTVEKAVEPFEFQSTKPDLAALGYRLETCTPVLDEMARKGAEMFHEIEAIGVSEEVERLCQEHMNALVFTSRDTVLDAGYLYAQHFDTKTIGNPLEATADVLINIIADYCAALHGLDEGGE